MQGIREPARLVIGKTYHDRFEIECIYHDILTQKEISSVTPRLFSTTAPGAINVIENLRVHRVRRFANKR